MDEAEQRLVVLEAILDGELPEIRRKLQYDEGVHPQVIKKLERELGATLEEDAEVERTALLRHNTLRLIRAYGRALKLGEFGPAVAAIKELNQLHNLYEKAAKASTTSHDERAALSESELDAALLAEVQAMIGKANARTK